MKKLSFIAFTMLLLLTACGRNSTLSESMNGEWKVNAGSGQEIHMKFTLAGDTSGGLYHETIIITDNDEGTNMMMTFGIDGNWEESNGDVGIKYDVNTLKVLKSENVPEELKNGFESEFKSQYAAEPQRKYTKVKVDGNSMKITTKNIGEVALTKME
ncbi:MAG: hypothetical protein LKF31_08030 [Muribaculaceae bacterium]|jgi:ABC-type enterochelin transport system substrate-binding protein|nr:hypothetical protein [Muribaculaceae bacterium]